MSVKKFMAVTKVQETTWHLKFQYKFLRAQKELY